MKNISKYCRDECNKLKNSENVVVKIYAYSHSFFSKMIKYLCFFLMRILFAIPLLQLSP